VPTPAKAPAKKPFPSASEIFIYRCKTPTETGMKRELIGNFVRGSDIVRVMSHSGPGRYRVEYRDAQRSIVGVRIYEVARDGSVQRAQALKKRRKVPPPTYVPPADRRSEW